jgi:hypothetical protein
MKFRKLNIKDVKEDEFYNLPEIALMLWIHRSTLTRKCHSGILKASNIWTEERAIWRVIWKDLINYIKK